MRQTPTTCPAPAPWTYDCGGRIHANFDGEQLVIGTMDSELEAAFVCRLRNLAAGLCGCGSDALMTLRGTSYCAACANAAIEAGELQA